MLLEARVLGRDDRVPQRRRDVVVADDHAPLGGELADLRPSRASSRVMVLGR